MNRNSEFFGKEQESEIRNRIVNERKHSEFES